MEQINRFVLKAWINNGLSHADILKRAEQLEVLLPSEYYNIPKTETKSHSRQPSNNKYPLKSFRPDPEVENYLNQLSKGKVSKFINESLRERIKQNGN